jgi:hypothetical protein
MNSVQMQNADCKMKNANIHNFNAFVKRPESRLCERSEAISLFGKTRLPRRSAPRNESAGAFL